jgi:hypothetical protein
MFSTGVDSESVLAALLDYNRMEKEKSFKQQHMECQICFVTALGLNFRLIQGCKHAYCSQCVTSYFETAIRKEWEIVNKVPSRQYTIY